MQITLCFDLLGNGKVIAINKLPMVLALLIVLGTVLTGVILFFVFYRRKSSNARLLVQEAAVLMSEKPDESSGYTVIGFNRGRPELVHHGSAVSVRVNDLLAFLLSLKLRRTTNGYVQFDLEDMPRDAEDPSVVSFSGATKMPDMYQMCDYMGQPTRAKSISRTIRFQDKHDRVVFAGASTGPRGEVNPRVEWAKWSLEHQEVSDIRITSIVENARVPPNCVGDRMTQQEQLQNKFILSVMGNGAAWDRVAWVLASNSILLMDATTPNLWYYEKLREEGLFLEVTPETIHDVMRSFMSDPAKCKGHLRKQNEFYANYLTKRSAKEYMTHLITKR